MKHKVAELEDALLDAAVGRANGAGPGLVAQWLADPPPKWSPSTDWQKGGPIIESERIDVRFDGKTWCSAPARRGAPWSFGPTPLIAAMRAYVASKLGDEIEL